MYPSAPIHPGMVLREEFLEPLGISYSSFAKRLGWTAARLSRFVAGRHHVTAESALDLAAELGTSPELWLIHQMHFDLKQAELRRKRVA
jgi:addiction module HigA family antidote